MSDDRGASPGPFRYHLELTPVQLKITHTALRSLLDDFGHHQSDVHQVIREVLDKLPDEHAMRAIRLDEGIDSEIGTKIATLTEGEADDEQDPPRPPAGDGPPPSAA